jgi:uncharacterized protein with HEPN domain
MENNEEMSSQELSEMIEYLIEIGAMEILGYDSVSDEIIWGIVINHIPLLQSEVRVLIGE